MLQTPQCPGRNPGRNSVVSRQFTFNVGPHRLDSSVTRFSMPILELNDITFAIRHGKRHHWHDRQGDA